MTSQLNFQCVVSIKFLLLFLILNFQLSLLLAQAPESMSYQAIVRDANNSLVTNSVVGVRISILQGSENGAVVFAEVNAVQTNVNGLFTMEIGTGTSISGSFALINWVDGPYFIKTEIDHFGGTSYSIVGVSQILSVPYAMYAEKAGEVNETDPIFGNSVAGGITIGDTIDWNQDNDPTNELQQLSVSITGDTLFLSNGGWVIIPGISGANTFNLYPPGTVHCSPTPTAIVNVINPITGKTWMDRNLGASQVATSSSDTLSYGDLYQWGRGADGHQCRNSSTTANFSSINQPGHGDFILTDPSNLGFPWDWRNPQNQNLWQGVNGVNNPCPIGYRIPTSAELNAERQSWSNNNSSGAFGSPLKLPSAGNRDDSSLSGGNIGNLGTNGRYWSSSIGSQNFWSISLIFNGSNATIQDDNRASGYSVRCIKQ